jgi:hypothetical protein
MTCSISSALERASEMRPGEGVPRGSGLPQLWVLPRCAIASKPCLASSALEQTALMPNNLARINCVASSFNKAVL